MREDILNELMKKVNLMFDPGIEEDVKGFFRGDDTVEDYRLKKGQNMIYELEIILKKPTKLNKENIFFDFIKFTKYSGFIIFTITKNKQEVKYNYLSATENMDGFFFQIYFPNVII